MKKNINGGMFMKRIKKDNKIIKFQSHGETGTVEKDVPQNTNEPNINLH